MNAQEKNKAIIGIVMGSASDAETMSAATAILKDFGIAYDVRVLSAHRTPSEAIEWVSGAEDSGMKVIIAAAGLAAHLAGVSAANTILPVIGVPMAGGPLSGFDALLSTVQMPKGTPVATVAVGKAGAVNAALLALRMLALEDASLRERLKKHKEKLAEEVLESDKEVATKLG